MSTDKRLNNLRPPWKKGESGNPAGKPVGAYSPITRIKQIFKENPEVFDQFVLAYMKDEKNRKHVVEMLDGKPDQKIQGDIEVNHYVITEGEQVKQLEDAKE